MRLDPETAHQATSDPREQPGPFRPPPPESPWHHPSEPTRGDTGRPDYKAAPSLNTLARLDPLTENEGREGGSPTDGLAILGLDKN